MIIINKKRLLFIEFALVFSIFFASLSLNKLENTNTISTSSTPVTGHTITLDAGHGIPDEGAQNKDGLTESGINLKIVLKLQKLLEASNCNVILTRSDENGIYDLDSKSLREMKVSDMKNRVKIGNSSDSDLFISIHLNKIEQSKYYGWQTFYKKDSEEGKILSNLIQENLNNSIQISNKRIPQSIKDKYIIENVKVPTVIVECGFLSNPEEANLLKQDSYQEKIAWGIYAGIMDFFDNSSKN
jgi:N-acetylmuramoyl-L-alanine amidase